MSDRATSMDRNCLAVIAAALVWTLFGAVKGHAQQPQSVSWRIPKQTSDRR